MKQPAFNIGELVYHILPESAVGVVVEIKYVYSTNQHEYLVAFSETMQSLLYMEHELCKNRNYKTI